MAKTAISIPLLFIEFGGARYGAGGCDVIVGNLNKLPAIAVVCDRGGTAEGARYITDEKGAQTWLHERGLPLMVAWGLVNEVRNGVGADAVEPITSSPGDPLWKRLNAVSYTFGFDSPECRAIGAVAELLRKRDL